jgi:hypothetical protein
MEEVPTDVAVFLEATSSGDSEVPINTLYAVTLTNILCLIYILAKVGSQKWEFMSAWHPPKFVVSHFSEYVMFILCICYVHHA